MVEAVTAALLLVSCVVALAIILEKFVLKLWWFGGKCIELLLKLPPPVSFTVSAVRFTVTAVRFTVTAALHLVSCVVALQAPPEEHRGSPGPIAESYQPQPQPVALPLSSSVRSGRHFPVTEPEAEPDSSDSEGWAMPSPGGMHIRMVKPQKMRKVAQPTSPVTA